ncbi:FecR family protein [Novosphingobium sp. 9]|uniref:FecR family protein n=1 Tax=Novosphingobium sp. 9 TaxID=2025349 RepID=UPI0021B6B602|nr:FecR domain-containing protein [Novosphingobium sp. 9]
MIPPSPAKAIDADAASWAARMDRGLSAGEEAQLEAWLAANSRHVGALARARAIWVHAEQAGSLAPLIDVRPDSEQYPVTHRHLLSRRHALIGIGALAASAAALTLSPLRLWPQGRQLATGIGEIRRVPLPDGSVVTLDTATSLTLRFTDTERRVLLHAGGAYFETVAAEARPFVVEAGVLSLEAGAAAFSVHALSGVPVTVLVTRGVIHALARAENNERSQSIGPGIRAVQSAGLPGEAADALPTRLAPLPPAEVDRLLSWRQGQLAFEGETLAHAAETFRRYASPAIEIASPELAREPITGLFAATDPAGFADAVALSLDARVSRQDGVICLTR